MNFVTSGVRRVSFAFIVATAATLVACGGGGGSGPGPTPPNPPTNAPPTKTPPTMTPPTMTPPTMTPPTPTPTMTAPPATMNPTASPVPTPVATSAPPTFASPSPAPAGKTNVIFEFGIPVSSQYTYANRRRPEFVSPGSKSFGIVVDKGAQAGATFNVGAGSPYCTSTATTVYCRVYEAIVTGNGQHDFIATLYSGPNASGSPLSIGDTGQVTISGTTVTPLLLKAVVANVKLTLQNPTPPVGTAVNDPLHIMLTDASGNTIADDSLYNPPDLLYNPVTLSSSDTTNGPLSHYGVNYQNDVYYVTAKYNGAMTGPITYSATCPSPASPPAPVAVPPCTVQNAILTP